MSEAEIFLIRQRMLGAKRAKAERGELILPLPAGYVRRPSGEAAFDPDEQAMARSPQPRLRPGHSRRRRRSGLFPDKARRPRPHGPLRDPPRRQRLPRQPRRA